MFQIVIGDTGRLIHEGRTPAGIADALTPEVASVLDELDRWLTR
ncbi:hypothetical protein [Cryptosporangium arvum]|nr:hypothetical protein [Cryptosporangium arvum]